MEVSLALSYANRMELALTEQTTAQIGHVDLVSREECLVIKGCAVPANHKNAVYVGTSVKEEK